MIVPIHVEMRVQLKHYRPPIAFLGMANPKNRIRLAVNGSRGQIGRAVLIAAKECPDYKSRVQVVVANDIAYQGLRRRSKTSIQSNFPKFPPEFIREHQIDTIIEASRDPETGLPSAQALAGDMQSGARTILYAASYPDANAHVIWGVNQDSAHLAHALLISTETCTASCVLPILHILSPLGLQRAAFKVRHGYDPENWRRDLPMGKFVSPALLTYISRLASSGVMDVQIPMKTTVGETAARYFPQLQGQATSSCKYVPMGRGIKVGITLRVKRSIQPEELVTLLRKAASEELRGALTIHERRVAFPHLQPGNEERDASYVPYSSVVSLPTVTVSSRGRTIRLTVFQDNIMGYAARLLDTAIWTAGVKANLR